MFLTLKHSPRKFLGAVPGGDKSQIYRDVFKCKQKYVKRSACACCGLGSLHCFCLFKCALQWRKTGHVDIIDSYAGSLSDTWFYFSASLASVFGLFSKVKFHHDFSLPLGAQISELSACSRGASELNLDITSDLTIKPH